MTHTLVTFLGKGRDNHDTGYRKARYRFPDDRVRETPFFGLELANYLKPKQLVILGTRGSQWGVLVENFASEGEDEDARIELMDAEAKAQVDQNLLDRVTPLLSRAAGRTVHARLIPYGRNPEEQNAILETIDKVVPKGSVHFDLTHGFRHLGMIGFLSAFMLERIGRLKVQGLWYGALDMMENGVAPVIQLDGLSAVQRWIDALDRFDATGDYGVFSALLIADGVPQDKAECLKAAAFYERNFNLADAKRKLNTFLPVLNQKLSGASGLFQDELRKRLDWVKKDGLSDQQRALAYQYLNRADYVRAAIFAWEAVITKECETRGYAVDDFKNGRNKASEELEEEFRTGQHPDWKRDAYWTLKNLRNALAHGTEPPNEHFGKLLRNQKMFAQALVKCIQRLLG
ncbi:MAG: TIGR02221 family CRISPR-associated protein [Thiobacillaceae bacterium]